MIRVLVSGAGGDTAQGVIKALRASPLDVEIFAACVSPDSAWLHALGVRGLLSPYAMEPNYIDWLVDTIDRFRIDAFFPAVDQEMPVLAPHAAQIRADTGAHILCGTPEQVAICADKLATNHFLSTHGFACPASVGLDDPELQDRLETVGFPLIVKPRHGRGSRDVVRINTAKELAPYRGDATYIAQQYLCESEGEFTSGIYLGDDAEIKGVVHFRRILKHGSTIRAERVRSQAFDDQLIPMAHTLGIKYLNIQSMLCDGKLIVFEFNGRMSGSTAMVSRVFNAPDLFLRERLLGQTVARQDSDEDFVALRYLEEIYTTRSRIDALAQRTTS